MPTAPAASTTSPGASRPLLPPIPDGVTPLSWMPNRRLALLVIEVLYPHGIGHHRTPERVLNALKHNGVARIDEEQIADAIRELERQGLNWRMATETFTGTPLEIFQEIIRVSQLRTVQAPAPKQLSEAVA